MTTPTITLPLQEYLDLACRGIEQQIADKVQAKLKAVKKDIKSIKSKKNWTGLLDPKRPLKGGNIQNIPKDGLTPKQRRTLAKKLKTNQYALFAYYNDDTFIGRDSSWNNRAFTEALYKSYVKAEPKTKFIILKQTLSLHKV